MGDLEPRNAASDLMRMSFERVWDREYWEHGIRDELAPNFVRRDRRKLVGMPDANADEWIAAQFEYERIAGRFGSWSNLEIIAVRGDRHVAARVLNQLGDLGENELVVVEQLDPDLERLELMVLFDPADIDEAIAELDRLHAEIDD